MFLIDWVWSALNYLGLANKNAKILFLVRHAIPPRLTPI